MVNERKIFDFSVGSTDRYIPPPSRITIFQSFSENKTFEKELSEKAHIIQGSLC